MTVIHCRKVRTPRQLQNDRIHMNNFGSLGKLKEIHSVTTRWRVVYKAHTGHLSEMIRQR